MTTAAKPNVTVYLRVLPRQFGWKPIFVTNDLNTFGKLTMILLSLLPSSSTFFFSSSPFIFLPSNKRTTFFFHDTKRVYLRYENAMKLEALSWKNVRLPCNDIMNLFIFSLPPSPLCRFWQCFTITLAFCYDGIFVASPAHSCIWFRLR